MHDTIKIHNFFLHQFNLYLPSSLVHLLTLLTSTNMRLNILYHMQQQTILQYQTNKEKILGQFKLQKPQQVEVCNFWMENVYILVFYFQQNNRINRFCISKEFSNHITLYDVLVIKIESIAKKNYPMSHQSCRIRVALNYMIFESNHKTLSLN